MSMGVTRRRAKIALGSSGGSVRRNITILIAIIVLLGAVKYDNAIATYRVCEYRSSDNM